MRGLSLFVWVYIDISVFVYSQKRMYVKKRKILCCLLCISISFTLSTTIVKFKNKQIEKSSQATLPIWLLSTETWNSPLKAERRVEKTRSHMYWFYLCTSIQEPKIHKGNSLSLYVLFCMRTYISIQNLRFFVISCFCLPMHFGKCALYFE